MEEIINGLWIGRPLGLMEQLSITSFLRNGHEYHLYCYEEIANIPAGTIIHNAAAILPASEIFYYSSGEGRGSVSAFSNFFRYKLLLEKGGWWVDTDVVCLRPFDFEEPIVLASERTETGIQKTQTTTAVLKLPKNHLLARVCYEAASRQDRAKLDWGQTGPQLLDMAARENGLQHFVKAPNVFCPVDHWKWRSLLSKNPFMRPVTDESHAIHLWHERWRRAGIKMDATLNDKTPFARLLSRYGLKK